MDQRLADPLLTAFTLKNLTLRNRIMSTSHACGLGDHNHMPGETYQRYHVAKAEGGLALTMFGGSSYIARDSQWAGSQLTIATDDAIPYFQQFADRVHTAGAALMIQITHLGRRAETNTQSWQPTIAPSAVRETNHRSVPRAMDQADIDRVLSQFRNAARRAQQGGLDGLEVMAHGHLLGQFLSPATNHRDDAYGGDLANRARFPIMVFEAIRETVGADFPVGIRFSIDESNGGGMPFRESVAFANMLKDASLVDFFNASYGRLDTEIALANECMPGMDQKSAPWLAAAGAFKKEVDLPVFHAAKITDIATARYALAEGLLDMVAMTRAHIADPNIVAKLSRGEEDRIRPCVGASHCMSAARPTCLHNPATGRERYWPQTIQQSKGPKRKIVVIGGGPAGLEAARVSAERGHDVTLFEAADRLGGQVLLAAKASWRGDLIGIIDWRVAELERLGVTVYLNSFVEADQILAEGPDLVVLATGGIPNTEITSGAELCTSSWDAISGAAPLGERVIIFDGTGRHAAPTVAELAARAGKSVDYVSIDETVGKEHGYAEKVIWRKRFAEHGITLVPEMILQDVSRDGNSLRATFLNQLTEETLALIGDTVVVEGGTVPIDDLFDALRGQSVNNGKTDLEALTDGVAQVAEDGFTLHRIGDAQSSRDIGSAMFDALRLCSAL